MDSEDVDNIVKGLQAIATACDGWTNVAGAVTAIVSAAVSVVAVVVACGQLVKMAGTMRLQSFTNVMELQAQMLQMEAEYEKVCADKKIYNIEHSGGCEGYADEVAKRTAINGVYNMKMEAALVAWFNVVDMLCFAIRHDYINEDMWKMQYRDYIVHSVVDAFPEKFWENSRYTNIKLMNQKWREQ